MSAGLTVKVAGETMRLAIPTRPSVREDICMASAQRTTGQLAVRVCAAALFMCRADTTAEDAPVYGVTTYDVLRYGGDVLDYLMSLPGVDQSAVRMEIVRHGTAAINMVLESMPTSSEVEEEVGNSPPTGGGG